MNMELFVQNVKTLCKQTNISPTAACRESGAGVKLMDNIKRGSFPSIDRVSALASYLGVTVSDLLGEVEPSSTVFSFADQELVAAYHAAPENIQKSISMVLDPYKKKGEGTQAM